MSGFNWNTPNPSPGQASTPEDLKAANDLAASLRPKDADAKQADQLLAGEMSPQEVASYLKNAGSSSKENEEGKSQITSFTLRDRLVLYAIARHLGVEI